MRAKHIASIFSISMLAVVLFCGINQASTLPPVPSDLNTGPYVDRLVYKVISNQNQRVLALQADEIETDTSFFDPIHYSTLDADPDIDIYSALRNGYGHLTINCRDWPLNESVLRRAFAFAFDKTRVTTEIMDGWSQEQDSLVPITNSWCIEEQLTPHYYIDLVSTGNALLDASGDFPIVGDYRTYRGTAFDIEIEYSSSSVEIAGGIAQIGVDALMALHINAHTRAAEFNEYISRLDSHGSYDMVFYAFNYYSNDVDWLAYEYWSGYADTPYQNPTNFRNATYDAWRDQLLYSTTYGEVYEAAAEMQKILHYNVPRLVVYENTYNQAYRIDEYTGYVEDLGRYISGPWSMRKVHKIDGTPGGTFALSISEEPDTFNIFTTNSASSAVILSNLWSSLYRYGPDLNPYPDLAESMIIETHDDNAAVPDGHTRFTIDIIQNATWSDGVPLTADDVAFTMIYAFESYAYGNPAGTDLGDLVAAYAPMTYRAIIEFSTESYWHFSCFAYDYIIPRHIFNDTDGIGYAGWNTWNPVYDPSEPNVNCGPFVFTDFVEGEFYEISRNPLFHYRDTEIPTTTTTSPTTTTTPTVSSPPIILFESSTSYVEGTTGNQLFWEVYDDNPLLFLLYKDGELNNTGTWDGTNFVVDVDGLSVGIYNYTLVLWDYDLNYVSSTVFVTVLPYSITTTDTTTTDTTSTTSITSTTSTSSTTSGTSETSGNILSNLSFVISIGSALVILLVVIIIVKQR